MEKQSGRCGQPKGVLTDAPCVWDNAVSPAPQPPSGEPDADLLLKTVIGQARALNIPVSTRICPHVTINRRALRRLGRCRLSQWGEYEIELSAALLRGSRAACCETLAHEVLHTCPDCMNHQALWRAYAERMNRAYGYRISRTGDAERLGAEQEVRYLVRCTVCGTQAGRMRRSQVIQHPERYRCGKCGGTLTVLTVGNGAV